MGTEGDRLSDGEEEEIDIELLKVGALKIAAKVAEELGGVDTSITLEYLVSGAYNHVWLLTYLPVSSLKLRTFNTY